MAIQVEISHGGFTDDGLCNLEDVVLSNGNVRVYARGIIWEEPETEAELEQLFEEYREYGNRGVEGFMTIE